ncbi:MAG: hypothetical protein IPL26_28170 [Leptospiraceae bacterium]|nr:hypothetical protein [Leptospiraceae bacterium]
MTNYIITPPSSHQLKPSYPLVHFTTFEPPSTIAPIPFSIISSFASTSASERLILVTVTS